MTSPDRAFDGWLPGVVRRLSPHFNERPEGALVSLAVLHFISLPAGRFGGEDVDALFMGTLDAMNRPEYESLRGLRVSSHFFVRRTGEVRQYVSVLDRAWHAGVSSFDGAHGVQRLFRSESSSRARARRPMKTLSTWRSENFWGR